MIKITYSFVFLSILANDCAKNTTNALNDVTFVFKIDELVDGNIDQRQLGLTIETTQELPCANYKIAYAVTEKNSKMHVRIDSIYLPEDLCLTAFAPAKMEVTISRNIKTVILSNGVDFDEYHLTDYDQYIEIHPSSHKFTDIRLKKIFFFQSNAMVIQVMGETNVDDLVADLMAELSGDHTFKIDTLPTDGIFGNIDPLDIDMNTQYRLVFWEGKIPDKYLIESSLKRLALEKQFKSSQIFVSCTLYDNWTVRSW